MPRLDGRLFRSKQLDRKECASIPVIVFTATEEGLPDVVAVVRKTCPDTLLDAIDRVDSARPERLGRRPVRAACASCSDRSPRGLVERP